MAKKPSKSGRIVSFPHMGNYYIPIKTLANLIDAEVITPPPITKRTLELGVKNSPEFVCIPFKYNLGNYIEVLEKGANVLFQAGGNAAGACRFGFYGEVQREIVHDLGYDCELINLTDGTNLWSLIKDFKRLNPALTTKRAVYGFTLALAKLRSLDILEDFVRKNIGFQVKEDEYEKTMKRYLADLDKHTTLRGVYGVHRKYTKLFHSIEVDKSNICLRVGIVGELYVLMEPFSNFFVEKELAKKGIEVHRFITVSHLLYAGTFGGSRYTKHLVKLAAPYMKYDVGGDGLQSVAMSNKLMKDGFDGMIHIKPFGCMPEVNAMPALQRLSRENNFPIIYFSCDSQTSETGVKTRLEAFYDMLSMRKKHENDVNKTNETAKGDA